MTEEEKKALEEKRKSYLIPLKSDDVLTEEERKRNFEIRSKGGKARQEQIARRKNMQEVMQNLLYAKVSKEKAKSIITDTSILSENPDYMEVLSAKMVEEVANGNYKAFETVRDTAGFSPKKEIDLNADVITASDRELIENVRKRLEKAE